jgi:hypothetical protein
MATDIHCRYCNSSQPRLRSLYPAYDFDVSREWFVHEPALPCDFPMINHFHAMEQGHAETTPIPDIAQAGDGNFAGPHYDVGKGDWVEGHILGNDGSLSPAVQGRWLEDISDDLLPTVPTEADVHRAAQVNSTSPLGIHMLTSFFQALQVIKHIGPTAGKLYLTNSKGQDNVGEYLGYTSSGFCLESRFFLTAAHWSSAEETNNRIFQPHNGIVHVSVAWHSKSWRTGPFTIHLLLAHCVHSIFREANYLNYLQKPTKKTWSVPPT